MKILNGKKILIAEDETDLREPLAIEFESFGCKVFQAKNGREAFDIVQKEKLDAVISDIRMPGGDGIELLKRIKEFSHEFPVVMLITGFSDLTNQEAYNMGAEAILSKPFDLDEIDNAVARILTPKDELWAAKIDETKIKIKIHRTFSALGDAIKEGHLAVGRGGFFITDHNGIVGRNEPLSFHIKFESGDFLSLQGCGLARWVRKEKTSGLPAGSGIEFDSLPEEVRKKVLALTSAIKTVPFIPKGP